MAGWGGRRCRGCDDLAGVRRAGVTWQRGSGRTRRSAKISCPGSLVAVSSCHAARGGGHRRRAASWRFPGRAKSCCSCCSRTFAGCGRSRSRTPGTRWWSGRRSGATQARCPACGMVSSRVHGGYARVVADGAAGGRPVLIVLSVRRFRCPVPACPAATFAEQAEGVSERYRRRSVPLLGMLAGFGLELAGRAAARLAGTLGVAGPFLHRAAAGHGAARPAGHRRARGHRGR